jgi:hypothetical protein
MERHGGRKSDTELGGNRLPQLFNSIACLDIDGNSIGIGGFAVKVEYYEWHLAEDE